MIKKTIFKILELFIFNQEYIFIYNNRVIFLYIIIVLSSYLAFVYYTVILQRIVFKIIIQKFDEDPSSAQE